jgi:hypothetical protein
MKTVVAVLTGFGALITALVVSDKLFRMQEHIINAGGHIEKPSVWPIVGSALLALGGCIAVWQSALARRSKTAAVCANLVVLSVCAVLTLGLAGPSLPSWSGVYLGLILPAVGFCALVVFAVAAWINE